MRLAGGLLTFLAVVVGWVFFRSNSLHAAVMVLQAMAGETHGSLPGLGGDRVIPLASCAAWLAVCGVIAFLLPNAYQVLGTGLQPQREALLGGKLGAALLGAMLVVCLLLLAISETRGVSEFLYFNF